MRFLLVHGPFHGPWCWDRTIAALARLGHDAVAVELPGHALDSGNSTTLAERRDAIVSVMEPGDVLVGHSSGGFDICIAADLRQSGRAIWSFSPPACRWRGSA